MKCTWNGCEKQRARQGIRNGITKYFLWCSTHRVDRYQRYKKDYCENEDGRLGFICEANPLLLVMLQVNHKDGNRKNNKKENLQTLCANCHAYKTINYDMSHHKKSNNKVNFTPITK
jgi:5-methylcytosine-specific restriction endonuclease McrA